MLIPVTVICLPVGDVPDLAFVGAAHRPPRRDLAPSAIWSRFSRA
jgi:hypothetical protein